jgi:S1-C subfamily serine protease
MPPGANPKPDPVRQLARSSCVRVVETKDGKIGSGTIVGVRDGFAYILTAAHVIAGGGRIELHLPGKSKVLTKVDVVAAGKIQDLALLKVAVDDAKLEALPIAGSPPTDETFDAVSAGYGDAAEPEVRAERVLARKLLKRSDTETWFAWECRDRPDTGRSGGALINKDGRLIGVCNGTQDGKGYYCDLAEIQKVLEKKGFDWLWKDVPEKGKK